VNIAIYVELLFYYIHVFDSVSVQMPVRECNVLTNGDLRHSFCY